MKTTMKAILSVLLTAALLCGMLTPAFAWVMPTTIADSRLVSVDQFFWFDICSYYEGLWLDGTNRSDTVYSPDGTVWYTQEAFAVYLPDQPAPDTSDSTWLNRTIDGDMYSPDQGFSWIASPGSVQWNYWTMYMNDHPELWGAADILLYRLNSCYVYCTDCISYNSFFPVRVIQDTGYNGFNTASMDLAVYTQSDIGVIMATDSLTGMLTWRTQLTNDDFLAASGNTNAGYDPSTGMMQYLQIPKDISYDPDTGSCVQFAYSDGMNYTFNQASGMLQPTFARNIYLRAEQECDILLDTSFSSPGMAARNAYATIGLSDFYRNDPNMDPYANDLILNDMPGASYYPLHIYGDNVTIPDWNTNGIIDPEEVSYTQNAYLGQAVSATGYQTNIRLHLQAGMIYRLPIFCWVEGQSPQYVGAIADETPVHLYIQLHSVYAGNERYCDPFTYAVKEDNTAVLLDFDPYYLASYANGVAGERDGNGCAYDPATGMLTLPDAIDGYTLSEIYHGALYEATALDNTCVCKATQIVLPDTVDIIGSRAFGAGLQRLHVPYDVQFSMSTFETRSPSLVICANLAGSSAEAYAAGNGISFETCLGHTNVALCMGATEYPVYTGDTMQVTVDLLDNPGLSGMLLHVQYDDSVLTLTDVQASGMFAAGALTYDETLAAVPFNVAWEDGANAAHRETGTLLTLTFDVKDEAAAGQTTISLTYDAGSTVNALLQEVPVDILNSATVTVFKHTPGDSDGDGEISLLDVAVISRYLVGGWPDNTVDMRNADVNGDGVVNLKDVILIRRYIVGGWGVVLI